MKQFFKFLFASCLGTFLAMFLIVFVFIAIGSSFSAKDMHVSKNSVLLIEFNSFVPEHTGNVEQNPIRFEFSSTLGLQKIKRIIEHAAGDDRIEGIVYRARLGTPMGMVGSAEIKDALQVFRDSTDKFVYSYADFYDNKSYLLASSSDSIFLNPSGMLEMYGYAAMLPFFEEMFDKIGVDMNIFYAGNYKSATEPFRRKDMSPANKEQTREYLNGHFQIFLDEIVESRNIPKDNLLKIINTLDLDNKEEAQELGLIDKTLYWHEFEDLIRGKLGLDRGENVNYIGLDEYDSKVTFDYISSNNRIAVVYAEGEVHYDSDEKAVISERKYHQIFDRLRRDDKIKAIVLRINSPGGSAFSSDAIWSEIEELKSKGIPVVASFSDLAASGGYYIAAGADKIVAHPQTLTGSIGVFTLFPDLTELMNEKLGIRFDSVKVNPHAIIFSPFFDLSNEESTELTGFIDQLYEKFLGRVAAGRKMTKEEVHEVAQGRVWTGARAYELGLVDTLGGLEEAIEIAARLAGVEDDYKISEYPKIKKDFWEEIMLEIMKQQDAALKLSPTELKLLKEMEDVRTLLKYREPLAILPFKVHY